MKIVKLVGKILGVLLVLTALTVLSLYFMYRLPSQAPERAQIFAGKEFAHRGGYHYGPENCLFTIQKVSHRGIKAIEVDLQLTRDGVLVLFHDKTLDRMTNGKGLIYGKTYAELKKLFLKDKDGKTLSKCKIASLDSYLTFAKREKLVTELDIKPLTHYTTIAKELSRLLKKHNMHNRVYASSFHPTMLYQIRKHDPRVMTSLSLREKATENPVINRILLSSWMPSFLGVSLVEPHLKLITPPSVKQWTRRGYVVVGWTANTKVAKERLKQLHVSFVSNCPGDVCKDHHSDDL
ncbi:MAG: hypothetical protein EP343_09070 [Deltaproteobacteria bacterium]|nr:MAG: hypothetical protein EP343_09070 [Deltaproteobacteria bacterium]